MIVSPFYSITYGLVIVINISPANVEKKTDFYIFFSFTDLYRLPIPAVNIAEMERGGYA
jgi:hypothetical protein